MRALVANLTPVIGTWNQQEIRAIVEHRDRLQHHRQAGVAEGQAAIYVHFAWTGRQSLSPSSRPRYRFGSGINAIAPRPR